MVKPSYSKFAKQRFACSIFKFSLSHFPLYILNFVRFVTNVYQQVVRYFTWLKIVSLKFEGDKFKQDRTASTV